MRELDLQEFVDEIYSDYKKNEDTTYIFFLGAGCSKSSGIPLAKELAKEWYEILKEQKIKFHNFNDIHNIDEKDIDNLDFGKHYFEIFESLFPTPVMQQKEIQRITNEDTVSPSLGYYVLASLMQKPPFNTIVTTNFDNLIQDALIYSDNKRALVITHQDLAKFIKRDNTPLIVKLHGDAHIKPFNNKKETKKIPKPLRGTIQSLFTNTKVICIGYGGNDESIKNLLEGCTRIDQVYWLNDSEPSDVQLSKWWQDLNVKAFVKEYDFDKIMNAIKLKFNIEAPNFKKLEIKLSTAYNRAVKGEIDEIEEIPHKTFFDYYILGDNYYEQKEYDKSIDAYKEALKLSSDKEDLYIKLGITYDANQNYDKAIEMYSTAIDLNSKNHITYSNLGNTYGRLGEYEKAKELYLKSIELDTIGTGYGYINLFEKYLIQDLDFDEEIEKEFLQSKSNDKEQNITYKMLKILSLINKNKHVDLDQWQKDAETINLLSIEWDFFEIDIWINNKKGKLKNKLLESVNLFKNKFSEI